MMRWLRDHDETCSAFPTEIDGFTESVVQRLHDLLRDGLVGTYLVGSAALGGYLHGRSDIDVIAVASTALTTNEKQAIVEALSHPRLECPTRGLEFVLYELASVATPRSDAAFEINLNTGPRMEPRVSFDPAADPRHWFIIDRAIARSHGVRLRGPQPERLFSPLPRRCILEALSESLVWHRTHDLVGHDSVLNACRAWKYATEDGWSSKTRAAAWAKARAPQLGPLIDCCLALRAGLRVPELDRTAIEGFVRSVLEKIEAAIALSGA
jgi:Domain of unknown function (DUF4111)